MRSTDRSLRPLPFGSGLGVGDCLFGLGTGRGWRQNADSGWLAIQRDGWVVSGPEISVFFVGEEAEVEGHAGDSHQKVMRMRHAAGASTRGKGDVQFRRCPSPHVQSALR